MKSIFPDFIYETALDWHFSSMDVNPGEVDYTVDPIIAFSGSRR